MDWENGVGWLIGFIGAVAAVGAWFAAWYPSRFRESWLIEPGPGAKQYLVRNNTNRVAEILETEVTALYPERTDEAPLYEVDDPVKATLQHGEAFGVYAVRARGMVITWRRRRWWRGRSEHSGEWTFPIRRA